MDKVFIPQEEHPEINFVGLLIGPRGNTLKMLEKDTNAKIIIRGKGSIKENKIGRNNGQPLPGEDEPLHAYITGPTVEVVAKACEKVREIVRQGIDVPETMNDLRRSQLRELALLNGTLRENDSLNKLKIIAQAQTIVTNTIICSLCGSAGHITSDCKMKKELTLNEDNPERMPTWAEREKMDTEYLHLMAELGQGQAPDASKTGQGKCIIGSRGSSSSLNPLAIEAASPSNEYSNSPKPNEYSEQGVFEEFVDGRKIIDMTKISVNQKPVAFAMPRKPAFLNAPAQSEVEDTASSMANAAMMYSQQMNYYAQMGMPPFMPMWPGAQGASSAYGWPPSAAAPPPPPPVSHSFRY